MKEIFCETIREDQRFNTKLGPRKKITDESSEITSESCINSSANSTDILPLDLGKNLIPTKSKSFENVTTAVADYENTKVNQLKRTTGTLDIINNPEDVDLKFTKSLNRLSKLSHTNQCVLSYHAKLNESTIWSTALETASERRVPKKTDKTCHSPRHFALETSKCWSEAIGEIPQEFKTKKEIKTDSFKAEKNHLEAIPNPHYDMEDAATKISNTLVSRTTKEDTIAQAICNEKHERPYVEKSVLKDKEKTLEERGAPVHFPKNQNEEYRTIAVEKVAPDFCNEKHEQTYVKNSILRDEEKTLEERGAPVHFPKQQNEEYRTIPVEKKVKMDVTTVKNEQGFDLLKYDVKSSGDSNDVSTTEVIVDQTCSERMDKHSETENPSRSLSDSVTEYEVMNLTQIDLFEEFKTTISKMRNVLNVLEEKKPVQDNPDKSPNRERAIEQRSEILTQEHISTQTGDKVLNQNSTCTECGLHNKTRNESVMVQLSSDTTSKHITLDSHLLKHIRPMTKAKRLKRRGYKWRTKKHPKKTVTTISSSDGKIKKEKEDSRYQKCVVYHISHHKNAIDRCVGTPGPKAKEEVILKNTFSALHFGPIKEFPVLLDKHENEKIKGFGSKQRSSSVDQTDHDSKYRKGKSSSFLSIDTTNNSDQNSWLTFRNQPSVDCFNSKEFSSTSDSAATANWFVFNPPPPVLAKDRPSTSEDIILDKNRDSTKKLVSRIIHEEFKTSGIKGKISSDTMNLIKDQFCDKLNGVNTKDINNVMITVSVPLKSIVSKMKSPKKTTVENKCLHSTTSSASSSSRLHPSQIKDKSIQVNNDDNLQTIPEKMVKKSTEIYQHNKMLRETMSSKRLATFKKVLGNKATSCSNMTPFGHLLPRSSRIFYSDHSTSSPDFTTKMKAAPSVYAHKRIWTTPRSSSLSLFKEEFGNSCHRRGGFYLNLPRHRCRKMREQISKLFDSDSSDRRFFTDSKLLYHVHESSFYSTSKTDDKFSSRRLIPSSLDSKQKVENTYFPVQEASSKLNLKVKSRMISFSDLPRRCDSNAEAPMRVTSENSGFENGIDARPKQTLKNAKVNTSKNRFLRDNETQFERVMSCSVLSQKKPIMKNSRKAVDTNTFFGNCIDEFSMVSSPKVHFEDDVDYVLDTNMDKGNYNGDMEKNQCDEEVMVDENLSRRFSNISMFPEDEKQTGGYCCEQYKEERELLPTNYSLRTEETEERFEKTKRNINLQTPSDSHMTLTNQKDFGVQLVNIESILDYDDKKMSKRSKNTVKVEATQVDTIDQPPKSHSCLVQVDTWRPTDTKLSELVTEVVNLCNSSFAKSRDCIVELTLYNLIKEIIAEQCSHLSEPSRCKVESILSNFVRNSKHKVSAANVDVVESAIENLVKEIGSSEFNKKQEEKLEDDCSLDKVFNTGMSKEPESRHKGARRSESQSKELKHEQSRRSRHRESEIEHREKHRYREEEKKHKQKHHHRHRYDEEEEERVIEKPESESKFRSVDGKMEYLELVRRLKELEEVTKQLSTVAKTKNAHHHPTEDPYRLRKNNTAYNASILKTPSSRRRAELKTSKSQELETNFNRKPFGVNFFCAETKNPLVPRSHPKLPVTKIVINLSNLKLLTEKCGSLSKPVEDPIVITDSTEQKQKLIDEIVSYQVENGVQRLSSKQSLGKVSKYLENEPCGIDNEKKESLTITIHEGSEKNGPSKKGKDFMKIKMVKKKKTLTSNSETMTGCRCSRRCRRIEKSNGVERITKAYMKKEYNFNNGLVCSNLAEDLWENKYNMNKVLNY